MMMPSAIDADMLFGEAGTVTMVVPDPFWDGLTVYVPVPPGDAEVWVAWEVMTAGTPDVP